MLQRACHRLEYGVLAVECGESPLLRFWTTASASPVCREVRNTLRPSSTNHTETVWSRKCHGSPLEPAFRIPERCGSCGIHERFTAGALAAPDRQHVRTFSFVTRRVSAELRLATDNCPRHATNQGVRLQPASAGLSKTGRANSAFDRSYFVASATWVSSAFAFGLVAVLRIRMSGGKTLLRP
jgi:hypothetical protein